MSDASAPIADSASAPVQFTRADDGKSVSTAGGEFFALKLQTIGGGQYGDPMISSAILEFLGMGFPRAQNPGGPTQVYHFRRVETGNVTDGPAYERLVLRYHSPNSLRTAP